MAKGFGQLYKMRGIITYKVSPFELKVFHGMLSHGFGNTLRRISENIFYMVPRKLNKKVYYWYPSAHLTLLGYF